MVNTVLLGHRTPVNKTILQFLEDDEDIRVQHLPVESLENIGALSSSFDVLLVDLRSFSQNPIQLIRHLDDIGKFASIIAINSLASWRLAELFLDAGAKGYLTKDTNEEELIEAITSISQGKPFVRI